MSHTYEAFVDIKEYTGSPTATPKIYTERYEVDALSGIHPKAAEFDVRITRLLK